MKNHYFKKRGLGAFTPWELNDHIFNVQRQLPNGKWGASRPLPYYSFLTRLIHAWDVLTYKADALYWGTDQD